MATIAITIGGVTRTTDVVMKDLRIVDVLNEAPNTCTFTVKSGAAPIKGQAVTVTLDGEVIFGGTILSVRHVCRLSVTDVIWELSCVDYTWLLDNQKVMRRYTGQSATTIVEDIINTDTDGFTAYNVEAGLPTIDEIEFTDEDVSRALTRIAKQIGAYWKAGYDRDIYFFITYPGSEAIPTDITEAHPSVRNFRYETDLSQVRTRVFVEGYGANAAADVSAGLTTLPVTDGGPYSGTGGIVRSGPQRITYTGVSGTNGAGSTTGYIAAPPSGMTASADGTAGSLDSDADYRYAVTYVTSEGETTPSPLVLVHTTPPFDQVTLNSIPVSSDPKVASKKLYRTEGGGAQLKLAATLSAAQTTTTDSLGDGSLGANAPTTNTAGMGTLAVAAGATSIPVSDLAVFPASGWAQSGGQIFRYTGRSASTGSGTLTGIPASGVGSITAEIRSGTIQVVPHLSGIPASGAGAIAYDIPSGERVNVYVQVDNSDSPTAASALAAMVGGDGVREHTIQDNRWTIESCQAAGEADLALFSYAQTKVTYECRDAASASGKLITILLGAPNNISDTLRIQQVVIDHFEFFPSLRYTVTATNAKFSLDDLFRRAQLATG